MSTLLVWKDQIEKIYARYPTMQTAATTMAYCI